MFYTVSKLCIKSKHKPILYFVLKKYINEIESWFCKCKFIATFTRKLKGSLIFKKISLLHYIDYFKNPINSKIGFNVMLNIFGHVRNFLIMFFFTFPVFFYFVWYSKRYTSLFLFDFQSLLRTRWLQWPQVINSLR